MNYDETDDPYVGGVDSGGIPPLAKVRLPDHVTKLRKAHPCGDEDLTTDAQAYDAEREV